jgi:predicted phosphodiesterase
MVLLRLLLAVLYDIHGNLPALEAVLEDARAAGADCFLLGGDYALFGAFPAQTLARLEQLPDATWIRGNVDRWTANLNVEDDSLRPAIDACREALGDADADALGALPEQVVLDGTRFCHASPLSDMRSFLPEPGDDDEKLLAGATEARVVFGHTHLAFSRTGPGGVELFNPGSVGLPLDGDARAGYALTADGGELEHRRVPYDREPSIEELARHGDVEWAVRTIHRLRTARP